jgi:ribosomal protein L5
MPPRFGRLCCRLARSQAACHWLHHSPKQQHSLRLREHLRFSQKKKVPKIEKITENFALQQTSGQKKSRGSAAAEDC